MTLAERAALATELVQTSRGFSLECPAGDDVITNALRERGDWEEHVGQAIDEHLRPGWTFLDIGAHVGYFSLIAARKGNPVIAVEPNPDYVEIAWRNAAINGVSNLALHQIAVGDYTGHGYLKRDERFDNNPAASYLAESGEEEVWVRRLTDILGDQRPEFIKLDIEGLEYRVLKDSPEILDAAKAVIVEVGTEMCDRYQNTIADVIELLRAHGFGVTFVNGEPLDNRIKRMKPNYYTNILARKDFIEEAPISAEATTATILLCAWRNLVAETAECLIMLRDRGWGYVIKRGDALISRSRAVVVSSWYRDTDEDVFLMIDDDVVFEGTGAAKVVELARETRSIACAAYPVKDGGHLACRRQPGQDILFGEDSPPVEIIYPATGFMAVHRDVITAMIEAKDAEGEPLYPFCEIGGAFWPIFDPLVIRHEDGRYEDLSEDYAFGERAARLGFKTWLEPSVILYHMGTFPYTIENMKNVRNYCGDCGAAITPDGRGHLPECEAAK